MSTANPSDHRVVVPFVDLLGFEYLLFEAGMAELSYAPKAEHLNSFAVTHGGALMTLLDASMAAAARSVQKDMGVVTIEMKTSFMRAARGQLRSKGHLMHRSATLAFTEGTVFDEAGRACAHATATFKYVRRLPIGPRSANSSTVVPGVISTD